MILCFNWSEPFVHGLATLGEPIVVADWMRPWNTAHRPLPVNVTRCTSESAARELVAGRHVDHVVALRAADLVWLRDAPMMTVFAPLAPPTDETIEGTRCPAAGARQLVEGAVASRRTLLVAPSPRIAEQWGGHGLVVPPGVDGIDYGGYTGAIPAVLTVGHLRDGQDSIDGLDLLNAALAGRYWTVIGVTRFLFHRDGEVWDDLRAEYRRHRLFARAPGADDDGHDLPLREAMATGMPIITTPHAGVLVRDGVEGAVAADVDGLKRAVTRYLVDPGLAGEHGAAARRRVLERFSLEAFATGWRRVLGLADRPAAPVAPVPPAAPRPSTSHGPLRLPRASGRERLRILISTGEFPAMPSNYYARALRSGHDVLTYGRPLDEASLAAMKEDFEERNPFRLRGSAAEATRTLRGLRRPPDIQCPEGEPTAAGLLDRLPRGWRPDLFVWVDEGGPEFLPQQLQALDCPTACLVSDFHIYSRWRLDYARQFDHVFAQYSRRHVEHFRAAGCPSVHFLPGGCDPAIHRAFDVPKAYDLVFVGQTRPSYNPDRFRLMNRLQQAGLDVVVTTAFMEEMALFFSRGRMVFNRTLGEGVIMRVFEAMACGTLLLTNRLAPDVGQDDLFEDRIHFVCYDEDSLEDLAHYYLAHPAEREAIARAGRREVLARHTYAHRAATLLATVFGETPAVERTIEGTRQMSLALETAT